MSNMLAAAAGLVCGILSGFGIGGGSLLMLWMTAVAGLPQKTAQGINLLYFLPTAGSALLLHRKNGDVSGRIALPAAIVGSAAGAAAAFLAAGFQNALLQKLYGGFLIALGCSELFSRADRQR